MQNARVLTGISLEKMYPKRNKFEMAAHELEMRQKRQKEKKDQKQSHSHSIETYANPFKRKII